MYLVGRLPYFQIQFFEVRSVTSPWEHVGSLVWVVADWLVPVFTTTPRFNLSPICTLAGPAAFFVAPLQLEHLLGSPPLRQAGRTVKAWCKAASSSRRGGAVAAGGRFSSNRPALTPLLWPPAPAEGLHWSSSTPLLTTLPCDTPVLEHCLPKDCGMRGACQ